MKQITITRNNGITSNELQRYLNDIRGYKRLTHDEVVELSIAIKEGSVTALNTLITANLPFVVSIAKYYQGNGLTISDLISEGNIGLINAAKKYDYTLNNQFSSFAVAYIRTAICNALNKQARTIRIPLHEINNIKLCEISVNDAINNNDNECKTYLDIIPSDTKSNQYDEIQSIEYQVKHLLTALPQREQQIICKLFGIGCQEESIWKLAKDYHLTEERIRQLKMEALEKMRQYCR